MTIIIGFVSGRNAYIGSDNAICNSYTKCLPLNNNKIIKIDDIVIGMSGALTVMQHLKEKFKVPIRETSHTDFDHMRAITKTLESLWPTITDKDHNLAILIGYNGKIYLPNNDWSFTSAQYEGVGCGRDYALGSMATSLSLFPKMPVKVRMTLALEAACKHNIGCEAPFHIVKVPPRKMV
jgi:hypothetical protein